MGRQRLIAALDRERTPFRGDHRRIRERLPEPLVIQRRRHNQQPKVVAQPLLNVEQQRKGQIGLEAALVKFIKDHQPDAGQLRIVLQHTGENTLGDHLQPRGRSNAGFGAHPVPYRLARFFIQQFRQALRHIARRQPARLQQDNFPADAPLAQNLQGQPGGFTRSGGRAEQNLSRMF